MFRNNISFILAKRGISISELARGSGLARNTVLALYRNRADGIRFSTISAICDYLGCTMSDIIEYVPNQEGR